MKKLRKIYICLYNDELPVISKMFFSRSNENKVLIKKGSMPEHDDFKN